MVKLHLVHFKQTFTFLTSFQGTIPTNVLRAPNFSSEYLYIFGFATVLIQTKIVLALLFETLMLKNKLILFDCLFKALYFFSWGANQVIGPPNVPGYGDNKNAWAQGKGRNYQEEFLHVSKQQF